MADLEISQFTNGNVPTDTSYAGGYKDANTPGGNRRWSFANIATYISTKLSLGTIVTQDADDVAITGGAIGGTDIDSSIIGANTPAAATVTSLHASDNLTLTTAAKTVVLKQGANGKTGTVTLNGVTPVSVTNSSITANSGIIFTLKTVGGTVGAYPAIQTITPTTGFDVAGTALDTSVYNYHIIESAA